MLTSRGCPVGCNFCYTTFFYSGRAWRGRKPEDVANEVLYVREKLGARMVYFDDDTMTLNHKHFEAIVRYFIENKVDVPWAAMGDVTLPRELVHLAKRAGLVGLKFGVESADPAVLRGMHKGPVSADRAMRFRELLKEEGIWAHATFSYGHPGDTVDSMTYTARFALRLDPESAQFSIVTPLPGTPLYWEAKERGWLVTEDFSRFDGANFGVLRTEDFGPEDVERVRRMASAEFAKHLNSLGSILHRASLIFRISSRGGNPTYVFRYLYDHGSYGRALLDNLSRYL
jgi:radical SAM superfamily enzyme YgiQ (UPF0313 family)